MKTDKRYLYGNIVAYVNKKNDTCIPKHMLDVAWVSMLHFHNFSVLYQENAEMIMSVYDSLKPGGKLVIADEPFENIPNPALNIITHYQKAGFVLVRGPIQDPIIKASFYLIFTKPDLSD